QYVADWLRARDVDSLSAEVGLSGSSAVHRGAVEALRHLRDGLWSVVPVRHEDGQEAGLASDHADVPRELDEDRRLVVGVREALAALLEGHPDDVLRLDLDAVHLAALGDVRVLAIRDG